MKIEICDLVKFKGKWWIVRDIEIDDTAFSQDRIFHLRRPDEMESLREGCSDIAVEQHMIMHEGDDVPLLVELIEELKEQLADGLVLDE